MIKHNLVFLIVFFITVEAYAQNSFYMKELTVIELIENKVIFENINSELTKYIQRDFPFPAVIKLYPNDYGPIYEISKNNYESIFLVFYKYGPFSQEYYIAFVIVSNDKTEIKSININTIDRRQDELISPFDLPANLPSPRSKSHTKGHAQVPDTP
jgi:hypothetical protein